jgi:rubrerythrin
MDILKIFIYALQREYEGKRFFEHNADRLSHSTAVQAFKTLAGEEQRHIDFIQFQIDALDQGNKPGVEFGLELEQAGFFSQRATSEVLDQTVVEAMVPDLPVLRMAYLIERDFAEFYEMTAERLPDYETQGRQVLTMLSHWERAHERLFKYLHDQAFERYAQMPWGG